MGIVSETGLIPCLLEASPDCSIIHCDVGSEDHVIYVRVTDADEPLSSTGPLPGILRETAKARHAKAHVIRALFKSDGEPVLVGHAPLIAMLRRKAQEWRNKVVGPSPVALSTLGIELALRKPGEPYPWPKPLTPDQEALFGLFGKPDEVTEALPNHGGVYGEFRLPAEADGYPANLYALLASLRSNGYLEIFTCHCGSTGCAGVSETAVYHENGITYLSFSDRKQECRMAFQESQYREEVLCKSKLALELVRGLDPEAYFLMDYLKPSVLEERLKAALQLPVPPVTTSSVHRGGRHQALMVCYLGSMNLKRHDHRSEIEIGTGPEDSTVWESGGNVLLASRLLRPSANAIKGFLLENSFRSSLFTLGQEWQP